MAGSRGFQGAVLKLLRAGDYTFTVTSTERVTAHYLRLGVTTGGLLNGRAGRSPGRAGSDPASAAAGAPHPTMWVRGWFPSGSGKVQQRAYTLVDPDPATDSAFLEFALHEGPAVRWALGARPGDTLNVTVLGSSFEVPDPAPAGWLVVGDPASIPALDSLAAVAGDAPIRAWLAYREDAERDIPVRSRPQDDVRWVPASGLVDAVSGAAAEIVADPAYVADRWFGFVATEFGTTRRCASVLRSAYGLPKGRLKSQAYWK